MDRKAIFEGAGKAESFSKALDFIDKAGHLSYEKFCRQAVNNSEALIEILQGTDESAKFLASKQIESDAVAERVKNILQRLHFNPADDYYLTLLLPRDADVSHIHRRWKSLMRIYHPDRQAGSTGPAVENATDCSKRINEVYDVLRDPKKKFPYDQHLGHPSKDGPERPSFSTKPGKSAFREMMLGNYFAAAVLLLFTVSAFAAGYYFLKTSPQAVSAPRDSLTSDKAASSGTSNAVESPAGPVSYAHMRTDEQPGPASSEGSDNKSPGKGVGEAGGKKAGKYGRAVRADGVLLAEEVDAFINTLTQAYDKGDLDAYLSCYSPSAVEADALRYDAIKAYYRDLFARGSRRLSMGNMVIRPGRDGITVTGSFTSEYAADRRASGGKVRMTLVRENGKLKIKYFHRIAGTVAD